MKTLKLCAVLLSLVFVASCSKPVNVYVINPSTAGNVNTMVEIAWTDILEKLPKADPAKLLVIEQKNGTEQASQVIYNGHPTPQSLIFQVKLEAGEQAAFYLKVGVPAVYPARTTGRFVPERKDDFAWENDRVAFRMYGPALAAEYPSNGVDIWMKRTEKLVQDKIYKDYVEKKISYHMDNGDGLDCYNVVHTLGAGGIAPFINDTAWVGGVFATQEVLDKGPLRTTFKLTYNNLPVGKKTFTEEFTISLDAGSQLNKGVVSFGGDFDTIQIAGGIVLHDKIGNIRTDDKQGFIAYAEDGFDGKNKPAGRTYVGVVFPDMTQSIQQKEHLIALAPYAKGESFTYYFGGGWDKWGFANDDEWFAYVAQFATQVRNPLSVTLY
jgi:hypothetical protein